MTENINSPSFCKFLVGFAKTFVLKRVYWYCYTSCDFACGMFSMPSIAVTETQQDRRIDRRQPRVKQRKNRSACLLRRAFDGSEGHNPNWHGFRGGFPQNAPGGGDWNGGGAPRKWPLQPSQMQNCFLLLCMVASDARFTLTTGVSKSSVRKKEFYDSFDCFATTMCRRVG